MDYTPLEKAHPKHQGIYEILIRTTTGTEKKCRADWTAHRGFMPIAENLLPGEHVYAWRKPE